ncbi:MAG: Fur family ferric uptake transcriptional regulator [Bradymonadia bacterium]|jgi:Fur family ferric uptake transcriptional regulator
MRLPKTEARALLQANGLRVTAPRLAVLCALAEANRPLSHSEVLTQLGDTDWDPATVYRNLVKLTSVGVSAVVSRAGGQDRYALASPDGDVHRHPHFVCEDCGRVACLPAALSASLSMTGPWSASVESATVQLRGACPDCRAS